LQAEDIRTRPVEGEKDCYVRSKMLFELLYRRTGVRIVAVGNYVALIGPGDGFENLLVHAGIVVAGEAAGRVGRSLLHSAIM